MAGRIIGITTGVDNGCTIIVYPSLGVHRIVITIFGQRSHTITYTSRNASFALAVATALGSNKNYTVGSTRTVDRGCGSIFEDGNGSNIAGVDKGDGIGTLGCTTGRDITTHDGNTIDHIQRRIGCVDRRRTTDTDTCGGTGLSVVAGDLHTGHLTLQHLVDRSGRYRCQIVTGNLHYGTGLCLTALHTVTNDDNLFERRGRREFYYHAVAGKSLGFFHTDVRNYDCV